MTPDKATKSSDSRRKKTQITNMENLIAVASSFVFAKPPLSDASDRYKLLHVARYVLALSLYSIFFFLRILLSLFPSPSSSPLPSYSAAAHLKYSESQHTQIGDSAIARALAQMLAIMNSIHVGSRKYELVRALAERVIDENVREGSADINRAVLSSSFSRTMGRLEEAMSARGVAVRSCERSRELVKLADGRASRAFGAVRKLWVMAGSGAGERSREGRGAEESWSAEKLVAELLWLAQKMAECGAAEEAVSRWAAASTLAEMAVRAEPRLQGALVKVSVFLFKQAKDMEELGVKGDDEYSSGEPMRAVGRGKKMNMLTSWLPLLCHASSGTDSPILSSIGKAEMETVLEQIIGGLSNCQQEQVLALWLHHFTACSSSDWPNLQACYGRWYAASRRTLR